MTAQCCRVCREAPEADHLLVTYQYPRNEYTFGAVDPWYVHGGGQFINTCGSPACAATEMLRIRNAMVAYNRERARSEEIEITIHRPDGLTLAGGGE